jgi:hypothetical protein
MTVERTSRSGLPIRVDELRRRDQVVFLGHVVEVLDVAGHPDFEGALQVMLRRLPEGKPAATLLPMGHQVIGMYLPRPYRLSCRVCGRTTVVDADLALGTPRQALCRRCSAPLVEGTVLMPAVRTTRRP